MGDFQIPMAMLFVVIMYILVGEFFKSKKFHLINETSFGVLAGMIIGAIYKANDSLGYRQLFKIDTSMFFDLLLPIIIFAGGYNLKKKRFLQNFKYILCFGFASTILNFLIIFSFTLLTNEIGFASVYSEIEQKNVKLTYAQMLLYSSTICATDSVAALTLISSDLHPKLFSVVFGEGMINDAVSIILFKTIAETIFQQNLIFKWYTPFELFARFSIICLLSVLMGLFIGLLSTLVFKKCSFLNSSTKAETLFALLMALCGYNLCEVLGLSGVIGLLMIGIIMSHYQTYNMSNLGKVTTRVTFDSMALMSEAFIYVYLGFAVWDQTTVYDPITKSLVHGQVSWQFTVSQVFIIILARLISVYAVYWLILVTQGKKSWKLSKTDMAITCFAGMIRGSVAFAMIETLRANPTEITDMYQINIIQSTVLFIVAGSTICFGTAMPLFFTYQLRSQQKEEIGDPLLEINQSEELQEKQTKEPQQQKNLSEAQKIIKYLDEHYFKRWFIHDYENRKHQINSLKRDIKKRDLQEIFDDAISDTSDGEADQNNTRFRIEVDEQAILSKNFPPPPPPQSWDKVQQ